MMLHSGYFHERVRNRVALAVYESDGSMGYCNSCYAEDFFEYDLYRPAPHDCLRDVLYINAQKYILVGRRLSVAGRIYTAFSLALDGVATQEGGPFFMPSGLLGLLDRYTSQPHFAYVFSVGVLLGEWCEQMKKAGFHISLVQSAGKRDGAVISVGPMAFVLSLAGVIAGRGDRIGQLTVNCDRCEDKLVLSVFSPYAAGEPNEFLRCLMREICFRGGMTERISFGEGGVKTEISISRVPMSGAPLESGYCREVAAAVALFDLLM